MLKIQQASFQQYMNCEIPDFQAGFRKTKEPYIKFATSAESSKKNERVPGKHLSLPYDYAKAFDCMDHNKLW